MLTNLDDADSRISYSGSWQAYIGGTQSSRQWDSSIHSTSQYGASATITFVGTSVKVYCTVPSGSGTNSIAIITLDGQKVATVTRTTQSNPVYYDTWYYSGDLPNIQHTIVITNGGSSSDSPLQLDALDIEGNVIASTPTVVGVATTSNTSTSPTPTIKSEQTSTPPSTSITSSSSRSSHSDSNSSSSNIITSAGSSSSSSQSSTSGSTTTTSGAATKSSGDKTVTTIQSVSTASDGTVSTQIIESPIQSDNQLSASSSTPVGAIVGAVVGGLAIVGIVLLLLCLRRRRRRQGGPFLRLGNVAPAETIKPTDVTPFNLEENNTGRTAEPTPNPVGDSSRSEKAALAVATAATEDPSSPSDELVDLALRRWIERHPEILLNRSALISTYARQSPIDARPSDHRRHDPPPEDLEMGTLSSMYASTIARGSSSESPPPAYQRSSKNNTTSHRWSTSPTSPTSLLSPLSPTTQL